MLSEKLVIKEKLWSRTFVMVTLTNCLLYSSIFMLTPIMPLFALNIGGSEAIAGIIVGIFSLIGIIFRPWIGNILDISNINKKKILTLGIIILLIGTCSLSVVYSVAILLLLRLIQGMGWSSSSTTLSTMAANIIPVERRNEGMGFYTVASTIGIAIAPATGLFLIKFFSFRETFLIDSIFIIIGLIISFKINFFEKKNLMIKFKVKKVSARNELNKRLFRLEKTLIIPAIIIFFTYLTYGGVATYLASYGLNRGVNNVGIFFTVMALSMLTTRPTMGKFADNFGATVILIPSMMLMISGLTVLIFATSLPFFLLSGVLYGLGLGTIQPIISVIAMSLVPAEKLGTVNATILSSVDFGVGFGAITWGYVAQYFGYKFIYIFSIFIVGFSMIIYLKFLKNKTRLLIN